MFSNLKSKSSTLLVAEFNIKPLTVRGSEKLKDLLTFCAIYFLRTSWTLICMFWAVVQLQFGEKFRGEKEAKQNLGQNCESTRSLRMKFKLRFPENFRGKPKIRSSELCRLFKEMKTSWKQNETFDLTNSFMIQLNESFVFRLPQSKLSHLRKKSTTS